MADTNDPNAPSNAPISPNTATRDLVERLLQHELATNGARLNATGSMFDLDDGSTLSPKQLADRTWLHRTDIPNKAFQVVIDTMVARLERDRFRRIKGRILDVETSDGSALERMVRLLAHKDTSPEQLEYYIMAFRQLIWQVKRRLRGLPSSPEIMLVLQGKQGTGKSHTVAKFGRVLDFLYMPHAHFGILGDDRRIMQLSKRYLICFDEMGQAKNTVMSTVKQVMTSDTLQARKLYENSENCVPRNASFIATTNFPLHESLTDTSGMRRFVEMRCRDERYDAAWGEQMNGINFAEVWACETGDVQTSAPIASGKAAKQAELYQDASRIPSDFDYFVENWLERGDPEDRLSNRVAFEKYRRVCADNGNKHMPIQAFAARLKVTCGEYVRSKNLLRYCGYRLCDEEGEE